jgi:putative transposase
MQEPEISSVQESLKRGSPLGDDTWTRKMAARLGLQYTLNPRGRPPLSSRRPAK